MTNPYSSVGAPSSAASMFSGSGSAASASAEQTFLNYMKETPAQQFEDSWLATHHLTEQQLANMSPAQREGIIRQMQQDMQAQVAQKLQRNKDVAAA